MWRAWRKVRGLNRVTSLLSSTTAVCGDLIHRARESDLKVKGPIRMPTKTLRITTRKTPCGEGSKTWDKYEMRVHKRVIDLHSAAETVKQIVSLLLNAQHNP